MGGGLKGLGQAAFNVPGYRITKKMKQGADHLEYEHSYSPGEDAIHQRPGQTDSWLTVRSECSALRARKNEKVKGES